MIWPIRVKRAPTRSGTRAAVPSSSPEQGIHFVYDLADLEERVGGRQLELQHQPVDLVDAQRDGESLLNRVLQHTLRVQHHLVAGDATRVSNGVFNLAIY